MSELAGENLPVSREVMDRDDAVAFFRDRGEAYKAEIIENIPAGETLTLYSQGEFTDLCRGPHVPSTGHLKAFKLTKVAGSYWRGDSDNEMLQRIYGTAWSDKKALKAYLNRLEEAGETRPPKARSPAGPVPLPGRSPGYGLLARQRLGDLPGGGSVRSKRASSARVSRGQDPADCRPQPVGTLRALGQLWRLDSSPPSRRAGSLPLNR